MRDGRPPSHFWGRDTVDIYSATGANLARIPSAFLTQSKTNTWAYILDIVARRCGVDFSRAAPSVHADDGNGAAVDLDLDAPPQAGSYTLGWRAGGLGALGLVPQEAEFYAPPPPMEREFRSVHSSDMGSAGTFLTTESDDFYVAVAVRGKGRCVVTGRSRLAEPTYLASKGLSGKELTNIARVRMCSPNHPANGVMLDRHLAAEYAKHNFAFYPLGGASEGTIEGGKEGEEEEEKEETVRSRLGAAV
ncbi:uncharacterized protein LOC62_03G005018 [Vanrija pseudolonga]|uniref:Uncharacterized protein n=1 Tax=Vanrija pseudolonga TaxID=143232 RepID=A0AAF1BKW5_9TREE|nr:hypothetical protein LOC62_03G005018 [Vanrija pseudolonga]